MNLLVAKASMIMMLMVDSTFAFTPSLRTLTLATDHRMPTSISMSFPGSFIGITPGGKKISFTQVQMGDASSSAEPTKKSFLQKLKGVVPPASERKKLIPLALMFFCILFNYTILRDTKGKRTLCVIEE
jgi:AAA family ATP:ADP antiporter